MRAGQPFACCAPASEVEARLFNGGIEGFARTIARVKSRASEIYPSLFHDDRMERFQRRNVTYKIHDW
jgi:hypothetical protein